MLRTVLYSILLSLLALTVSGQGLAHARSTDATVTASTSSSADCMRMMNDTNKSGSDKQGCNFATCLVSMAGCSGVMAPSADPAIARRVALSDDIAFAPSSARLTGLTVAPPLAPPRPSL
ncbi:MAG: hypothetical protein ABGW87_07250 [Sphingomonadaceae bacterium]